MDNNKEKVSPYASMYSVFHLITGLFALYLSFKCNNGLAPDLLFACCCPVLYIIYKFATSTNFCGLR